jgi:hypothetical protein
VLGTAGESAFRDWDGTVSQVVVYDRFWAHIFTYGVAYMGESKGKYNAVRDD